MYKIETLILGDKLNFSQYITEDTVSEEFAKEKKPKNITQK
ncbi:hypothetical protein [Planococcus kocurii]|nr:hypothetical protein [Planococcus kocurii]